MNEPQKLSKLSLIIFSLIATLLLLTIFYGFYFFMGYPFGIVEITLTIGVGIISSLVLLNR